LTSRAVLCYFALRDEIYTAADEMKKEDMAANAKSPLLNLSANIVVDRFRRLFFF
jgi:hypothetical protein